MSKRKMIPVTIKADEMMYKAIGDVCSAPNMPTKAEFIRDAITSYLNYYETVLMPTLRRHNAEIASEQSVDDFYRKEGRLKYESRF